MTKKPIMNTKKTIQKLQQKLDNLPKESKRKKIIKKILHLKVNKWKIKKIKGDEG